MLSENIFFIWDVLRKCELWSTNQLINSNIFLALMFQKCFGRGVPNDWINNYNVCRPAPGFAVSANYITTPIKLY